MGAFQSHRAVADDILLRIEACGADYSKAWRIFFRDHIDLRVYRPAVETQTPELSAHVDGHENIRIALSDSRAGEFRGRRGEAIAGTPAGAFVAEALRAVSCGLCHGPHYR